MQCPVCRCENSNSALKCDCGHIFTKEEKEFKTNSDTISNDGYFSFKSLIGGSLIKIIYLLGVITIAISSVSTLFSFSIFPLNGLLTFGIVCLFFIVGNFLWRIICERWILLFSIHEILSSIERNLLLEVKNNEKKE